MNHKMHRGKPKAIALNKGEEPYTWGFAVAVLVAAALQLIGSSITQAATVQGKAETLIRTHLLECEPAGGSPV